MIHYSYRIVFIFLDLPQLFVIFQCDWFICFPPLSLLDHRNLTLNNYSTLFFNVNWSFSGHTMLQKNYLFNADHVSVRKRVRRGLNGSLGMLYIMPTFVSRYMHTTRVLGYNINYLLNESCVRQWMHIIHLLCLTQREHYVGQLNPILHLLLVSSL